ncbi:MAG: Gfo/Idh/MocA family oxidoreductase [Treponema sp.]|nr:Gfo/Idh/MocA family oxidoreductase [Treponema sp.]
MLRVGVVGTGDISRIYLDNITKVFSDKLILKGVTNKTFSKAEKTAAEYNVKAYKTTDELLQSSDIDIILNLTPPKSHYEVALAALRAGKHVYNEKPVCTKREEAQELIKTANEKGIRIGSAPDTFLGAGLQTCRKLIDDGWIGKPAAATAFMMSHGIEHWHPSPHFFYKEGAGPMLDIGPYYLTALINLLGPITRVCGSAKMTYPVRTITNQFQYGQTIDVEIPTHITGVLDFACGTSAVIITSFDIHSHSLPFIEIYGSEGTMKLPDPNTFGGEILIKRFNEEKWSSIPLLKNYSENSRGLGLAEMAEAIEQGRPHRASFELAYHVLDVMHGIHDASASGKYYKLKSKCKRPEAM